MDAGEVAAHINAMHGGTFAGALGLVVTGASRDEVSATLEITAAHRQPQGIVHGGVYATVIESLASVGRARCTRGRCRSPEAGARSCGR
jgi:1,4-dihydroxy-2-naphthoyl-CoA hydrolase